MRRAFFFNKLNIKEEPNKSWKDLYELNELTIKSLEIAKDDNFFCIGSCFAENVRYALEKHLQCACFPRYESILVDKTNSIVDTVSSGIFHMNHYSPISILQEFQRALGSDEKFEPIEIKGVDIVEGRKVLDSGASIFQDPYRREVLSKSKDELIAVTKQINKCVADGLASARNFIITLGLIEVFRSDSSGLVFNQFPGYMGIGYSDPYLKFQILKPAEVVKVLEEIVSLVKAINRQNKIIFSVSPVPLQKTFSAEDIFVANTYSKSVLRAAVNEVICPSEGIYYFPSFEIALNLGANFYQDRDLRHAKKEYVDLIVQYFIKAIESNLNKNFRF